MAFDISRLVISAMLMWGDDAVDVISANNLKNCALLTNDNITEFCLKTTLSSMIPSGYLIYKSYRNHGDLANAIDAPIIYANINAAILNDTNNSTDKTIYFDESFNELCVINKINIINDTNPDYVFFKLEFELADILNINSTLTPYSTFSENTEYARACDVIKNLFGSANLGHKLNQDSVTIETPIIFTTTENSSLSSSLQYVYRMIFNNEYYDASLKQFIKMRYNYTTKKYEMWDFNKFATQDALLKKCTHGDNEVYKNDVNMAMIDILKLDDSTNNRILLLNNGNSVKIPLLSGKKTQYDFDYITSKFSITNHEYPATTFLTPTDNNFGSNFYKKYDPIYGNAMYDKMISFNTSFSSSRHESGLYNLIDYSIMNTQYVNITSNVVLRRKAGDTILVKLQNSGGSDYTFLDGAYLITESTHKFIRSDSSNGGRPTFNTYVNVYSPFATKNVDKISKKV